MGPVGRHDTAALVLAGGASRRFGADKLRAEVAGQTLLERVLDVVTPVVGEVLVLGPWAPAGQRHLVEPEPHGGPLAALTFGLGQVAGPRVLVLAGDHPALVPALLERLLERGEQAEAAVALRDGRREPLVACYRTSVREDVQALLDTGERSLQALLRRIEVVEVPEPEWRVLDPDGRSFLDVDTPEDLARFEA